MREIEGEPGLDDLSPPRVDVLDDQGRFVTSADCELNVRGDAWSGMLTGIEPNARLGSGRYRLRSRAGVEAPVVVQARQRIAGRDRYPFVGVGPPAALDRP